MYNLISKLRLFSLLTFFFIVSFQTGYSQNNNIKITYKYTFEGMKDSSEVSKIESSVMKLKKVISVKVIFKSQQNKYSLLIVDVETAPVLNENNTENNTGSTDLKKILISLGYTPSVCKEIINVK